MKGLMKVIRIAMAKGRISGEAVDLLKKYGVVFEGANDSRKLIIPDTTSRYELILVKPADTPVYVERGVAECGIVGRDVILESDPDVYSLFSIPAAQCRLCVAGKPGTDIYKMKHVTAASKFTDSAHRFFEKKGISHDVVLLNGSVELAPLLGMSDVIVDIVETGSTLRENGLVILEEICDIAPVFIVNKAALKTKYDELAELIMMLKGQ